MSGTGAQPLTQHTIEQFLHDLASRTPAPSGGAVAAITAAAAAALTAMAARFNSGELAELAERADTLQHEAGRLADRDADAYGAVLAASRLPADDPDRTERLSAAIRAATDVPLQIAATGSEIAKVAVPLASTGNVNLRGDAAVAALLADGVARAAHTLVELNAKRGQLEDSWAARSAEHARAAQEAIQNVAHMPPKPTP